MIDYQKIKLSSVASSLKVYAQGEGTIELVSPYQSADEYIFGSVTIPHDYGSDNLLWQVSIGAHLLPYAPFAQTLSDPSFAWELSYIAYLDENNLYIEGAGYDEFASWDSSVVSTFSYRLLIP